MIAINTKLAEVLNDLVKINNDRVKGYEKAANEIRALDSDLESKFHRFAQESQKYSFELSRKIADLGGEPSQDTTTSGKIYRVWMDVSGAYTGHNRQIVLENCEYGEDAAKRAYKTALETDIEWDVETRGIVLNQQASIIAAHDEIKRLRDVNRTV
jgi:uncharacterized protein (TIGR02284 family)